MFKENKYTKWYLDIINNRLDNPLPKSLYQEKHHIIPKGLGGNNKKENIVSLTAREHYICHRLLVKMTTGKDKMKMAYALRMMITHQNKHQLMRHKINSSEYERIKKEIHQAIKPYLYGTQNPFYGRKHTEETKAKMRAKRSLQSPPMLGKHRSDETKQKLREANQKQFQDPEQKNLRRKINERLYTDPERRKACGNGSRGTKWFYSDSEERCIKLPKGQQPPPGFQPGRKFYKCA